MSAQTNETLARALFTAFNARKFDDATRLASDKFVWRNVATGETYNGPAGMRQFMEGWVHAFRDAKADVKRIIATDRNAVVEYVGHGTHTGTLETTGGAIPATNRHADIAFCDVCAIEGGKLVSIATYFDVATMMQQLGVAEHVGAHR